MSGPETGSRGARQQGQSANSDGQQQQQGDQVHGMASVGGARPGAGRPMGGVTQKRLLLERVIESGLEQAGREKGLTGDREAVIEQTGAALVADMIRAGQGADVLKLWSLTATKAGAGKGEQGGKSSLASALERVSGQLAGPDASRSTQAGAATDQDSGACAQGATAAQSEAPRSGGGWGRPAGIDGDQVGALEGELVGPGPAISFAPQRSLPLADAVPAAGGRAPAPPHPPAPASRDAMDLGAPPSEKKSGGSA